jgi:hypothetical protein
MKKKAKTAYPELDGFIVEQDTPQPDKRTPAMTQDETNNKFNIKVPTPMSRHISEKIFDQANRTVNPIPASVEHYVACRCDELFAFFSIAMALPRTPDKEMIEYMVREYRDLRDRANEYFRKIPDEYKKAFDEIHILTNERLP